MTRRHRRSDEGAVWVDAAAGIRTERGPRRALLQRAECRLRDGPRAAGEYVGPAVGLIVVLARVDNHWPLIDSDRQVSRTGQVEGARRPKAREINFSFGRVDHRPRYRIACWDINPGTSAGRRDIRHSPTHPAKPIGTRHRVVLVTMPPAPNLKSLFSGESRISKGARSRRRRSIHFEPAQHFMQPVSNTKYADVDSAPQVRVERGHVIAGMLWTWIMSCWFIAREYELSVSRRSAK